MVLYYNGYSPNERSRRFRSLRRDNKQPARDSLAGPCEICGDPNGPFDYHSEDCSWPYRDGGYCLCRVCHRQKLHRRFANPSSWATYCEHVYRGGYGREAALPAIKSELKKYQKSIQSGLNPDRLEPIPNRAARKAGWWRSLTCDREVLARFDSRSRADADILRALKAALPDLNPTQIGLIKAHYRSINGTSTVSDLTKKLGSNESSAIRKA